MKLSLTLAFAILANLMFVEFASAQASAQSELNAEVDSEIEQMYQQNTSTAQTQNAPSAEAKAANGAVVTQTVVVPAQVQQQQSSVQKQPETTVEGSPLSNSRAESIRRGRQEEELKTESRIVEKLEQSRLEDEKKRAAILFGDKFDTLQNQQAAPQAAPQQAPSSQVQPVIINQNETLTRDAVREEVRAALSEDDNAIVPVVDQKYFTAGAGIGQYPDVDAIKGNYALGAGFGSRWDLFLVEGSFTYSNYTLTANYADQFGRTTDIYGRPYTANFDMNQYQGSLALKYQLLGGFVRPVLGGLASYSYRQYVANNNTAYGAAGKEFGTSHALDLGVIAGIDLEFNAKTSIGADLRYMWNMSNKISGQTAAGSDSVEDLEYFTTGLFARVNF